MTTALNGQDIAKQITEVIPGSVISADATSIIIENVSVNKVADFLKNSRDLDFNYLANLTAVDYMDYFEILYHLTSLTHNHSLILKTRCYTREKPIVSSVVSVWRSADYQEREVYDLMGIVFQGHPNLKRLFLWEGFEGYPLRRDYL